MGTDESDKSEKLARERTHLANERTLLAYVRTALALTLSGAVLIRFFSDDPSLFTLAWVLLVGGGLTIAIGGWRYVAIRRQLDRD